MTKINRSKHRWAFGSEIEDFEFESEPSAVTVRFTGQSDPAQVAITLKGVDFVHYSENDELVITCNDDKAFDLIDALLVSSNKYLKIIKPAKAKYPTKEEDHETSQLSS